MVLPGHPNKWGGTYRVAYGVLQASEIPNTGPFDPINLKTLRTERKYGFNTALIESVRREGFRNPILWMDPAKRYPNQGATPRLARQCPYGGSRCLVARHLGLPLPTIVCDHNWNPRYDDWRQLESIDDVLACFRDPPSFVRFTADIFEFWGCDQVHLAEGSAGLDFFRIMQPKSDGAAMRELLQCKDPRTEWYSRHWRKRYENGLLVEF